jgi:hypothetical protein
MPAPPVTIADVLHRLDAIVDDAIRTESPIGYFTGLYDRVTQGIKMAIVAILARLVGAVQLALVEVSPRFKTISAIQSLEDKLLDFALDTARDGAWAFAVKLAALPSDRWSDEVAARDRAVVAVGRAVLDQGPVATPILNWVREKESRNVPLNIQIVAG